MPPTGLGVNRVCCDWQWVNTRRLLTWRRWSNAWSALRAWTGRPPVRGDLGDRIFAKEVARHGWTGFEIVLSHGKGAGWQELGPTKSLHELVLAEPRCMQQNESGVGLPSACMPVRMRAGWNASRSCDCLSVDGKDASKEVLNCAGTDMGRHAGLDHDTYF